MSITDLITTGLAIYATVLSTILAWQGWRKDQRKVKVLYNVAYSVELSPEFELIQVKAVNVGHRPVTITGGGLWISDKRTLVPLQSPIGQPELPVTLHDGESVTINIDLRYAKREGARLYQQGARLIKAFVRDSESNLYFTDIPPRDVKILAGLDPD